MYYFPLLQLRFLLLGFPHAIPHIEASFAKDHAHTQDEAFIEIHKRLRDGDLATAENAKEFFKSLIGPERYDLSKVGRFRFNQRFERPMDEKALAVMTLSIEDIVLTVAKLVELNINPDSVNDDIDHLGSRRVRFVGELQYLLAPS
jgi:DNA-directed RNA polymerase subunit beta